MTTSLVMAQNGIGQLFRLADSRQRNQMTYDPITMQMPSSKRCVVDPSLMVVPESVAPLPLGSSRESKMDALKKRSRCVQV